MAVTLKAPLVLAGAGRMGSALLKRLIARGLDPKYVRVQEPHPSPGLKALLKQHGIAAQDRVSTTSVPPAVIVVAVKPQMTDDVWPNLAKLAGKHTLTISVAAGQKLKRFESHLSAGAAVVRAMPNTPAAIGRGMTVCCPNQHVSSDQKQLCSDILSAVGTVSWIEDETLMDAVTAVSGSGPAYVFHLAECLKEAGVNAGLSDELADQLARETISGAGALLASSDESAATLRENVTSPGGTTEAALKVLRSKNALRDLMVEAIAAAKKRSEELSS